MIESRDNQWQNEVLTAFFFMKHGAFLSGHLSRILERYGPLGPHRPNVESTSLTTKGGFYNVSIVMTNVTGGF